MESIISTNDDGDPATSTSSTTSSTSVITTSTTDDSRDRASIIATTTTDCGELFEHPIRFSDLLYDRSDKQWFLVSQEKLRPALGSIVVPEGILLCNPHLYGKVNVYLTMYYFDTDNRCVFKASALDHVGKSDIFLGCSFENGKLLFHISHGLQMVDVENPTCHINVFDSATKFMAYYEENFTGN